MKISLEQFILQAEEVHGKKFDYSNIVYVDAATKINITCKHCGLNFDIVPSAHLRHGCRGKTCRYKSISFDELTAKFTTVHNGKYSYENNKNYVRTEKICITCPRHGYFYQLARNHLSGQGCIKCKNENQKWSTEKFIHKAKEIHGNRYDYSRAVYQSSQEKITVICKKHGEFYPAPSDHILGPTGCRTCGLEERFGHIFEIGEIYQEYKKYYKRVRYLTMIEYKKYENIINPDNLPRGNLQFHVDHMYSVKNGYLNNIIPEIISSYVNLAMLSHSENSKKSLNNSHTKEELIYKYEHRKFK